MTKSVRYSDIRALCLPSHNDFACASLLSNGSAFSWLLAFCWLSSDSALSPSPDTPFAALHMMAPCCNPFAEEQVFLTEMRCDAYHTVFFHTTQYRTQAWTLVCTCMGVCEFRDSCIVFHHNTCTGMTQLCCSPSCKTPVVAKSDCFSVVYFSMMVP